MAISPPFKIAARLAGSIGLTVVFFLITMAIPHGATRLLWIPDFLDASLTLEPWLFPVPVIHKHPFQAYPTQWHFAVRLWNPRIKPYNHNPPNTAVTLARLTTLLERAERTRQQDFRLEVQVGRLSEFCRGDYRINIDNM